MTPILLLIGAESHGTPLDAILLPNAVADLPPHRIVGWRFQRYYSARFEQELRGIVGPPLAIRLRTGAQYQQAWRAGRRPNLRFQDMRRVPLQPPRDPAVERRRHPDAAYVPLRTARIAGLVTGALAALALGRWLA